MAERGIQLKIMLSDEEKRWLSDIALRRGLTVSDVIRQFIRDDHQRTGHAFCDFKHSAGKDAR